MAGSGDTVRNIISAKADLSSCFLHQEASSCAVISFGSASSDGGGAAQPLPLKYGRKCQFRRETEEETTGHEIKILASIRFGGRRAPKPRAGI